MIFCLDYFNLYTNFNKYAISEVCFWGWTVWSFEVEEMKSKEKLQWLYTVGFFQICQFHLFGDKIFPRLYELMFAMNLPYLYSRDTQNNDAQCGVKEDLSTAAEERLRTDRERHRN